MWLSHVPIDAVEMTFAGSKELPICTTLPSRNGTAQASLQILHYVKTKQSTGKNSEYDSAI